MRKNDVHTSVKEARVEELSKSALDPHIHQGQYIVSIGADAFKLR